jgi:hypothetical protein
MLVRLMLALSLLNTRHVPSSGGYLNWSWTRLEKMYEFANIVSMESGGGTTELVWCRRSAAQGFEIGVILAIEA